MTGSVIFGVTGFAGRHIAHELAGRGLSVLGASRSTLSTNSVSVAVETRQGSFTDRSFVAAMTAAAHVVILAIRSTDLEAEGRSYAACIQDLLELLDGRKTRLGVVGGSGTLRLPGTSTLNMNQSGYGRDPSVLGRNLREAQNQAAVLDTLRNSGLGGPDWFYVSPPALFGSYAPGTRTGRYRLGRDELLVDGSGLSTISGADFAIAFADEIEHPRHHRERFTVAY